MSISVVSPSMKNSSNFQYILSKPKRPYTEVIYEDDYSFHNVKIKGKSL